MNLLELNPTTIVWLKDNMLTLILSLFVFVQWVALQGFLIHYHYFRKSLKRPKPDALRISLLEKNLASQNEQLVLLFNRYIELKKEIASQQPSTERANPRSYAEGPSLESSYVSLGEMNLKKRLKDWGSTV